MTRNKNRLYLAFYPRTGQPGDYHLALLLTPKNPGREDNSTWRYHVMNKPDPSRPTQQEWVYQPRQVVCRTMRLFFLVLLEKTQLSGDALGELLKDAPVVQDDQKWNCRDWAFGAIEYLQQAGVISELPMPLKKLYAAAVEMADEVVQMENSVRNGMPIPTCDSSAQAITSEIE